MNLDEKNLTKLSLNHEKIVISDTHLPSTKLSAIVYTISVFLLLSISFLLVLISENLNHNIGIVITNVLCIILPCYIFMKIFKCNIRYTLRLNNISFETIILLIAIFIFAIPVAFFLNYLFMKLLEFFIESLVSTSFNLPTLSNNFILSFLCFVVLTSICEEILFRGFILRGLQTYSKWTSILITSFLFTILHLSIEKFIFIFILSSLIGYFTIHTNSIYSGIIGHGIVNTSLLFISVMTNDNSNFLHQYIFNYSYLKNNFLAIFTQLTPYNHDKLGVIFSGFILIAFLIFIISSPIMLIYFIKKLRKSCINTFSTNLFKKEHFDIKSLLYFIPVLSVLILLFIAKMFYTAKYGI